MKQGDLVEFVCPAWAHDEGILNYRPPGVVLTVEYSSTNRFVSDIMWRDGGITREYDSRLQPYGRGDQ